MLVNLLGKADHSDLYKRRRLSSATVMKAFTVAVCRLKLKYWLLNLEHHRTSMARYTCVGMACHPDHCTYVHVFYAPPVMSIVRVLATNNCVVMKCTTQ